MDLFATTDPLGRVVRLTQQCFDSHILIQHPDMDDWTTIERGIRLADWIMEDAIDSQRTVYYRTYQRQPQHWLIKVVVEQHEVITAYRVKRMKQGEVLIWQR